MYVVSSIARQQLISFPMRTMDAISLKDKEIKHSRLITT
jgi:hypothetical protein